MNCFHELINALDAYAIEAVAINRVTVGHLSGEISRVTKFSLDCGAKISLVLSSTHYPQSPIVNWTRWFGNIL